MNALLISNSGLRFFVVALLVTTFALMNSVNTAEAKPVANRPNIILIMADDMGWSDIGCYGGEVKTPNLDRLASDGLRFTQFYNNAKCTTTRVSILTGLYPRNGGRGIDKLLTPEMMTVAEALKNLGYQTALSGKWHLGQKAPNRPIDRGFDVYYGLMDGCCNFFNPTQPDPPFKGGRTRVFGHNDQIIRGPFPEGYYTTDTFTDHAIETVRQFARKPQPFLLHVSYTAPHYPLQAKTEDIAKYKGKYRSGWQAIRQQRHRRLVEMGLIDPHWQMVDHDPKAYDWAESDQEWESRRMATYAAMIDSMDQNIGRILQTLERLNILDKTAIFFLSDNGGCAEEPGGRDTSQQPGLQNTYTAVGPSWAMAQNTPFRRYKSQMYEGGIATPMIAYWPSVIQAGTVTDQVGHIIDFMPTFLEMANREMEAGKPKDTVTTAEKWHLPIEGLSLLPILKGQKRPPHQTLYWHFSGSKAIRQGRWKLVWDKWSKQWELFDVIADRTEHNNQIDQFPNRAKKMQAAYQRWAVQTRVEKLTFTD